MLIFTKEKNRMSKGQLRTAIFVNSKLELANLSSRSTSKCLQRDQWSAHANINAKGKAALRS